MQTRERYTFVYVPDNEIGDYKRIIEVYVTIFLYSVILSEMT